MNIISTILAGALTGAILTGCTVVGDYPIGGMYTPAPYAYQYSSYGTYNVYTPARPYQTAHYSNGGEHWIGGGWNHGGRNWGGGHTENHERNRH